MDKHFLLSVGTLPAALTPSVALLFKLNKIGGYLDELTFFFFSFFKLN